jgi:hypothetical protein
VADTLVKPIQTVLPAFDDCDAPAKQTDPQVRRKVVRPLELSPYPRKPIARPMSSVRPDIESELAEIRRAFRSYRSTNSRKAVYIYLSKVFELVSRWRRLDCALKNARAALRLQANAPLMKSEPFAIIIFCTSDPEVVDAKTRSKWSRALRYAWKTKPSGVRLIDYIRSKGGLNECTRASRKLPNSNCFR